MQAGERIRVSLGAHPALAFQTTHATVNGVPQSIITARRYLAGEVAPDYVLSEHVSVGAHYLYSHGLEDDATRHNHFVAARASLSDLRLSDRYVARLNPQVYYLRIDDRDGVYLYLAVTLARRGLPLALSALVNQPVRTNVPGGKDFLWNVSLTYAIR